MNDLLTITFKEQVFRLRRSQDKPDRLILLIHGWTGDENSMWVLARRLPPEYVVVAPRGPHPLTEGGYSWREILPGSWGKATIEDLRPAAETLMAFVDGWFAGEGIPAGQFDLMGFSQGAALTYTLALIYPDRVLRFAALSGFIPVGGEALISRRTVSGKSLFISHGRQDVLIPVDQARNAATFFMKAGARVTYCETDDGHKVNKECMRELDQFFGNL